MTLAFVGSEFRRFPLCQISHLPATSNQGLGQTARLVTPESWHVYQRVQQPARATR
jgi:hypothetical protein